MKSIDERIVDMRFNNKQFEDGIQTSMKSLENLRKGLDDTGKNEGLSGIQTSVGIISERFSAMGIIAIATLQNITNSAINTGAALLKSITIEPVSAGFTKYEQKVGAVQTIMNATGKTIDEVTVSLEKLNWFTDETSYNFTDMVSNIGKFTSAGVDLDVAVTAMQGIANAAALSGQGTNEASRAMYNFAQAMGVGSVKLMDWKSIENANMATVEFKQSIIDTAESLGSLKKQTNGTWKTMKGTTVSITDFNSALTEGWFSSEVLIQSLQKYGEYADAVFEVATREGITCAEAMAMVSGETMNLGMRAFKAAQEAKTFTDAVNSVKDAVSTGWMNTFEILFGNYVEAKELWTDLANTMWDVFAAGAEVRNEMLQLWKDLGGRDDLIQSFKNGFHAIVALVTPLKEAFREIFPPMTAEKLFSLTEGLKVFTEKLKMSEETAANVKSSFKGVFAAIDIGRQFVGFLAGKFGELVKATAPIGDSLLGFTAGIGEWIAGLNDAIRTGDVFNVAFNKVKDKIVSVTNAVKSDVKGMLATPFFVTLQENLENAGDKIKAAFDKIEDTFRGFKGIDLSGAKEFVDNAVSNFRPFTALGNALSAGFEVVKKVYDKVAPFFNRLSEVVSKAMNGLSQAIGGAFRDGGIQGVLDLVNGGLFAGILLGIKTFMKSLTEIADGASGFVDGITSILDGVKGSLEAYQNSLKANTLLTIASAIAVLAAALVVLSLIDPNKLGVALVAITTLFIELAGAMIVLNKAMGPGKMVKVSGELLVMSTAILVLSFAMKNLAELDWEGVMKGIVGVGALAAILVTSAEVLSRGEKKMITGSIGMIAMAAAIVILTQAVKQLGGLDPEVLLKVLGAVGVLMVEIAGFTRLVKPEKLLSTGIAMNAMGAAMLIFANAVRTLGEMDLAKLGMGVGAIGVLLAEIAGFTQIVKPEKLISTGIAMIAMGAALTIMSGVVRTLGETPIDQLAIGLVGMGVALAAIAGFTRIVNPANLMVAGIAMIGIGAGLVIISKALSSFGRMSWEELAIGLIALAGSLTIIAVAATAMATALPGAAAMVVMSGALLMLAPALMMLGSMDLAELGTALLALVGVFTIVGVAGLVLAPLTPVILGLAAAIALLGIGVFAIGAGLLAFSAGLTALAVAGTAGAAALAVIVTSLINLIPFAIQKLGEGVLLFAQVITAGMPAIMEAVRALAEGLIAVMVEITPSLTAALLLLLLALLEQLADSVPQMVDAGMRLLIGILKGIEDHTQEVVAVALRIIANFLKGIAEGVPDVVAGAVDIVVAFIEAIGNETPRIVDAGFKMVINFVNGLANAIRENTPPLVDAFGNLAGAMVDGLVAGVTGGITTAVNAVKNLGSAMLNGVKGLLGIHSPSKVFEEEVGKNVALGTAQGIENNSDKASKAAKKMADDAYSNAKLWIKNYQNDTEYLASEELAMWELLATKYENVSKEKVEIDKNIANLREKIAREEYESAKTRIKDYQDDISYSASEEKKMWEALQSDYAKHSKERIEIDKNISNLQAKMDKESFNQSKDWINQKKELNELSMTEEVAAWERVQSRYLEGTEERKEADRQLFAAKQRLFDEQERLMAKMEDAEARYQDAVDQRTQSIVRSYGLFDELQAKEEVAGKTLTDNLKAQVADMQTWATNLATLAKKGIDEGLLAELQQMGPSAGAEIAALSRMSDGQLTEYENLWKTKTALARTQAISELKMLREETNVEITAIKAELEALNAPTTGVSPNTDTKAFAASGKASMDAVVDGYKAQVPTVVAAIEDISADAKRVLDEQESKWSETGETLMASLDKGLRNRQPNVISTCKLVTSKALGELASVLPRFFSIGQQSVGGYVEGMKSRISEAAQAAAAVAKAAYLAAIQELDIHSPSRKFAEIGRLTVLGLAKGITAYSHLPEQESAETGSKVIESLRKAMAGVGDIINSDIDVTPTIRPVIDLSNARTSIKDLNNAFKRQIDLSSALDLASSISHNMGYPANAADKADTTRGTTMIFNQTNQSPKALSRIEIYRNTKNQLSAMKEVLT